MKITTGSSLKIQQGNFKFQYWATISATLIIVASGMHYGWPSPSLEQLLHGNSTLHLTPGEGSWMAVMVLLGAIVGSLIVGTTVDILGRKRTIILTAMPFFGAWIMIAYANSPLILYIARFIAGVADGWAFTAVPMYVGEIADPSIRGLLGSGVSVSWILGMLLINIIGSFLSIQTTALISSIVPVIGFVSFIFMPESPYYHLMRGKYKDAKRSLQIFRGMLDVEVELARLTTAVKAQTRNAGKFLDLFTGKASRRAVVIMVILRTAQQLSGNTAITFYNKLIFKEASSTISSELATIIYFSVQLICTSVCSSIVDKAGRRPLLVLSICGSALALFIEGTYFYLKSRPDYDVSDFHFVPVAALIGFVIIFSFGMQAIPILMLGELFPANVKAFALCLADIYFSIVATIVSKFFQMVKDHFGIYVPFWAFTVSCLGSLICIYYFVPETKGKSLEEIQKILTGDEEDEKESEKCVELIEKA